MPSSRKHLCLPNRVYALAKTEADRTLMTVPTYITSLIVAALLPNNQKTSLTNSKSKPEPAPETSIRRSPEEQREVEKRLLEESRAEWEAMMARRELHNT
jgi:hypothetical protein